jgi:hypothetical protein
VLFRFRGILHVIQWWFYEMKILKKITFKAWSANYSININIFQQILHKKYVTRIKIFLIRSQYRNVRLLCSCEQQQ